MPDSESYSPVQELNLLMEVQEEFGTDGYARGFGLETFGDRDRIALPSGDPELTSRLIDFARANASGSRYWLWRLDDRPDLATLPVVASGDEGGLCVVARNLRELFQILACDAEPIVAWDGIEYLHEDDDEHTEGHEAYVRWLASAFGLSPADDPNTLVAAAEAEYGERFEAWWGQFMPDVLSAARAERDW